MQLKINQKQILGQRNRDQQPTTQRTHQQQYNYQYYQEFKRLYQTAYYLSFQTKQLTQTKEQLWGKLLRLQKKTQQFKDDIRGEPPQRKRRFRRTAEQIERKFTCQVERCQKCYGSQGSLQQHIKLKHPQLYKEKVHYNRSNLSYLLDCQNQEESNS